MLPSCSAGEICPPGYLCEERWPRLSARIHSSPRSGSRSRTCCVNILSAPPKVILNGHVHMSESVKVTRPSVFASKIWVGLVKKNPIVWRKIQIFIYIKWLQPGKTWCGLVKRINLPGRLSCEKNKLSRRLICMQAYWSLPLTLKYNRCHTPSKKYTCTKAQS